MPNQARDQARTSVRHGSASKQKKPPAPPVAPPPQAPLQSLAFFNGSPSAVRTWNYPWPIYKPYLNPGQLGRQGSTWAPGFMFNMTLNGTDANTPPSISGGSYGFRFYYSPETISTSTSWNPEAAASQSSGNSIDLSKSVSAMGFSIMINRQDEVLANTKTGITVMGSSSFRELGTTYDVEMLYRVFNGDSLDSRGSNAGTLSGDQPAMQMALGARTNVFVKFSRGLRLYGYCTQVTVEHQLFSAYMVPTVSKVSLEFVSVPYNDSQVPLAPNAPGTDTSIKLAPTSRGAKPSRTGVKYS